MVVVSGFDDKLLCLGFCWGCVPLYDAQFRLLLLCLVGCRTPVDHAAIVCRISVWMCVLFLVVCLCVASYAIK